LRSCAIIAGMRRLFNGCLVGWLIAGLAGPFPGVAGAKSRATDAAAGWVPAISVFGGLISASRVEPKAPSTWAEPENPLAVGDTVEIIQIILLPESVAVAAGAPDDAARFVIENRAAVGSGGGERWVLTTAEPMRTGTQRADGSPPDAELTTDSVDGASDLLVEPPAPRSGTSATPAKAVVRDETERWVPSFAIFSGVIAAELEADVESGMMGRRLFYRPSEPPPAPQFSFGDAVFVPPLGEPLQPVRPPASGDDLGVEPFIGGQLELMTPALQRVPGRPRFYIAGDVSWSFGFNRDVAKEADPGEMELPEADDLRTAEASVEGQGSRATTEPEDLVIGANAGIAFTIDIGERRLRIKPNAGYLRQELEYTGSVNRAVKISSGRNNFPQENTPATWETIKIEGRDQEVYHAIGPGLELEFDAARAGPFMLSLFAGANAYKIIAGDRTIEFEGTDTWEQNSPDEFGGGTNTRTEEASWKFVKAPWSYRGAVGIRFRWLPE
jgi:hypothetical protein